jgi:hypothetical protein
LVGLLSADSGGLQEPTLPAKLRCRSAVIDSEEVVVIVLADYSAADMAGVSGGREHAASGGNK